MIQKQKTFLQQHLFKILIPVSAIVIVLFASLFFLNIGMVNAEWNAKSNIEGFQINNATGDLRETVFIHIDDSSLFAEQIRFLLVEKISSYQTEAKLMNLFNETSEMKNASFIGIHITKDHTQYCPWSAENKYTVFYYYSDIGNTAYYPGFRTAETMYDHPAVVFNSSNGAQLLRIGDISIEGDFNGFFSKPKMQDMTINYIAEEIAKHINSQ